jgi:hypothetical protein
MGYPLPACVEQLAVYRHHSTARNELYVLYPIQLSMNRYEQLDHYRAVLYSFILPADRYDPLLPVSPGRAEREEQHLILIVLYDARKLLDELCPLLIGQLAPEHRILHMIAISSHQREHRSQALVVADIIGHDIKKSHLGNSLLIRKLLLRLCSSSHLVLKEW